MRSPVLLAASGAALLASVTVLRASDEARSIAWLLALVCAGLFLAGRRYVILPHGATLRALVRTDGLTRAGPLRGSGLGPLGRLDSWELDLIHATTNGIKPVAFVEAALDYRRHGLDADEAAGVDPILLSDARRLHELLSTLEADADEPVLGSDEWGDYWMRTPCVLQRSGRADREEGTLRLSSRGIMLTGGVLERWAWNERLRAVAQYSTLQVRRPGHDAVVHVELPSDGAALIAEILIGWGARQAARFRDAGGATP